MSRRRRGKALLEAAQGGPMTNVPPGGDQHGWTPPPSSQPPPGWNPPAGQGDGQPSNGMGVAALVLGIIALLISWIPILGAALAVLALIFGILGLKKARRGQATNQGMAVAGIVLGGIALAIGLLVTIAGVALFNSDEFRNLTDCLADADTAAETANCEELFKQDVGR
ncbi:MAG: DUF4190 domain-containing protein [Actinobacteria bacterium]|nr:DUF4190 domain-containing protein [Actinomycetota bacterium]